jgi:hypothetical protein
MEHREEERLAKVTSQSRHLCRRVGTSATPWYFRATRANAVTTRSLLREANAHFVLIQRAEIQEKSNGNISVVYCG